MTTAFRFQFVDPLKIAKRLTTMTAAAGCAGTISPPPLRRRRAVTTSHIPFVIHAHAAAMASSTEANAPALSTPGGHRLSPPPSFLPSYLASSLPPFCSLPAPPSSLLLPSAQPPTRPPADGQAGGRAGGRVGLPGWAVLSGRWKNINCGLIGYRPWNVRFVV